MENPHRRGLAGALFAFGGAASRSTKTAVGIISQPEKWALYLVLFAGVITIIKKNATPDMWSYAMWFGIALGLAALLYEMTASRGIVRAYWEGRAGSMLWCGMIWAVAFGFSVNNWMGAASENQAEKTNLHKAAYTATVDTRQALKDAEDTLARLKGKFDWSKEPGKWPQFTAPDPSYHGLVFQQALGPLCYIMTCRTHWLRDLGGALSPFNSFLFLQGLETLPVRMAQHTSNAAAVARASRESISPSPRPPR